MFGSDLWLSKPVKQKLKVVVVVVQIISIAGICQVTRASDWRNGDIGLLGCWSAEPHDRPPFRDVLTLLDEISRSDFVMTTHESFREIQEDWHREIEEMFNELRTKEKVKQLLNSS